MTMSDLHPNLFKNLTRNPITIILLDGRKQTMVYDKTTKLNTLFEETCALCNLDNENLFGFATLMDDYYAFLNLETKVCKINFKEIGRKSQNNILFQSNFVYFSPVHKSLDKNRRLSHGLRQSKENNTLLQSKSSTKSAPVYSIQDQLQSEQNDVPVLYFRIKSYVFPHCLRDKTTKSLYFLQLLRNVLDYKLKCVDEIYLQLGAFAIQAFYGDYSFILSSAFDDRQSVTSSNTESSDYSQSPTLARLSRISASKPSYTSEEVEAGRYFEPKKFFPSWIISKYTVEYLYKEIPQLHRGLAGMGRIEAEFSYVRMASAQYSNFNMHLFPVRDKKLSASNSMFGGPPLLSNGKQNGTGMMKNYLWLGLSPAGLEIHEMKHSDYIEHLSTLKWSDIDEVTRKSSRIIFHVGIRSLKLHTNTKMQADHLFWLTRHMHMYQTKAGLSATCTEEALETADRQKYRENYVYMDLEDLKQNGILSPPVVESSETVFLGDTIPVSSKVRMPFANTPAAPPRRTPSKAKPLKMKDLLKMAHSNGDSVNDSPVQSFQSEKQPQYIKKSRPTSQASNYAPLLHKGLKSPDSPSKLIQDTTYYCRMYPEDSEKTESDQNTSKIFDTLDDSDVTGSIYESDSKSPPMYIANKPTGRFVSLARDLTQDTDLSQASTDSPDRGSVSLLPPPQQFREPIQGVSNIGKSTSFDINDLHERPLVKNLPQRHQSDPLISNAQLNRSAPLLMGLCCEFNNTNIIDNIKSGSKMSKLKFKDHGDFGNSVGLKSWKSDVLFDLSTCLDDDNVSSIDPSNEFHPVVVLPRRSGSYRGLINQLSSRSSSSIDSNNDHDSVDISSISSFEMNDMKYSRFNIGHNTQVTII